MDESQYFGLCRLSTENYLQLEKVLFEFADIIYVYDDWGNKSKIFTMQLANLHGSICAGIEESMKLFLLNPMNNLVKAFTAHIDSLTLSIEHKNDIKKELNEEKLDNIKLKWILDFKCFREKLNDFSSKIVFSKPPFQISFPNSFGEKEIKPIWFDIYEAMKHNFYSKYSDAKLEIVFYALAAYYLIARMLAHEATFIGNPKYQNGYYPWYEANINIDRSLTIGASDNDIQQFKSKHFEALRLGKKT